MKVSKAEIIKQLSPKALSMAREIEKQMCKLIRVSENGKYWRKGG